MERELELFFDIHILVELVKLHRIIQVTLVRGLAQLFLVEMMFLDNQQIID